MNIECFRETLNTLTVADIIGENAQSTVDDVCEVFDSIKGTPHVFNFFAKCLCFVKMNFFWNRRPVILPRFP